MRLVLVGLPGSGKSTVGRQLARRLGLSFQDSDHVIEQQIGCSIRDFFARMGEEAFRDLEQAVIDDLMTLPPCVIATGGGAVLRQANRDRCGRSSADGLRGQCACALHPAPRRPSRHA